MENVTPFPAAAGPRKALRVLVADGDPLARRIIREQLAGDDLIIAGEARDGEEAVAKALELNPDVVVMELLMPRLDGLEATQRIVAQAPSISVVLLSQGQDEELGLLALRSGAAGFLEKDISMPTLARVIHAVDRGEAGINRGLTRRLISELRLVSVSTRGSRARVHQSLGAQLSAREEQVLALLAMHLSTVEIAERLGLSRETVRTHVRGILRKLRVQTREEAVAAVRGRPGARAPEMPAAAQPHPVPLLR
ncbi:MAG TPA: response regulator transcription factor [Solirubrobacteraceae bacterium]|nr:response regulator transcription factor [Solirubrobacteraceae bacterium]